MSKQSEAEAGAAALSASDRERLSKYAAEFADLVGDVAEVAAEEEARSGAVYTLTS